jgi:hypothetical protein
MPPNSNDPKKPETGVPDGSPDTLGNTSKPPTLAEILAPGKELLRKAVAYREANPDKFPFTESLRAIETAGFQSDLGLTTRAYEGREVADANGNKISLTPPSQADIEQAIRSGNLYLDQPAALYEYLNNLNLEPAYVIYPELAQEQHESLYGNNLKLWGDYTNYTDKTGQADDIAGIESGGITWRIGVLPTYTSKDTKETKDRLLDAITELNQTNQNSQNDTDTKKPGFLSKILPPIKKEQVKPSTVTDDKGNITYELLAKAKLPIPPKDAYLGLQYTRLQNSLQPIDENTWTWLAETDQTGTRALDAAWGPIGSRVYVSDGSVGDSDPGYVARLWNPATKRP